MPLWISIICIVAAVVIGAGAGIFLGIAIRKNTAEKEIGSAEEEAKKIVADAIKTAEARKKEVVLEGKDETRARKKFPTDARKFSVRREESSKRKKLLTKSLTIWNARKKRSTKSFVMQMQNSKKLKL